MGTTQFLTGQSGSVVVGGSTTLNVLSWDFEVSSDEHDTTHSGSGNYSESIMGILHGKGNFKANWDALAKPTTNPPNLIPGVTVALRLNLGTSSTYILCTANITGMPINSEVKGMISWSCSFVATGSFTLP